VRYEHRTRISSLTPQFAVVSRVADEPHVSFRVENLPPLEHLAELPGRVTRSVAIVDRSCTV